MQNKQIPPQIAPDIAILNKALKRDRNLKVIGGCCLILVAFLGILEAVRKVVIVV